MFNLAKNNTMKTLKMGMLGGLVLVAFMWGCKKKDADGGMRVLLTDAPGPYLHVNVDVQKVEAHYANGNNWVTLNSVPGIYDLIALQNNVTAVLANNTQVPAGKVSQMRLILGTNNTVVLSSDSSTHPLSIPSSYNTGVKINIDATIPSNQTVTITLDYDANKSINKNGNGEYIMNPVISAK
jgi:hypothetical protein